MALTEGQKIGIGGLGVSALFGMGAYAWNKSQANRNVDKFCPDLDKDDPARKELLNLALDFNSGFKRFRSIDPLSLVIRKRCQELGRIPDVQSLRAPKEVEVKAPSLGDKISAGFRSMLDWRPSQQTVAIGCVALIGVAIVVGVFTGGFGFAAMGAMAGVAGLVINNNREDSAPMA